MELSALLQLRTRFLLIVSEFSKLLLGWLSAVLIHNEPVKFI